MVQDHLKCPYDRIALQYGTKALYMPDKSSFLAALYKNTLNAKDVVHPCSKVKDYLKCPGFRVFLQGCTGSH